MIADGYHITDLQEDQVLSWIHALPKGKTFQMIQVAKLFEAQGVPWLGGKSRLIYRQTMPAYRAADRLLQHLRRVGVIRAYNNKNWEKL